MSDAPDRSDKTFDPTPRRLQKAREEGQVFRSREMGSVALLAVGAGVIGLGAPAALDVLRGTTARVYSEAPLVVLTPQSTQGLAASLGIDLLLMLGPLFVALMVVAFGANVAQTGWVISTKAIQPKANRISPAQGMKRLFSSKGLFELVKALAKVVIVGPVVYIAVRSWMPDILTLHLIPLDAAFPRAGAWVLALLVQMLLALGLLAMADFAFEKWKYTQDLKMTHKEIKDEAKDSEGDPHIKNRRRQIALERARRPRLDHAVFQADVVVTNPTHYAVALAYDPARGPAPIVLAKGIRKRAEAIKALAAEHGIPTVEDVPLARSLYASVEEGDPIDESLYAAVAAVLAEIYRLHGRRSEALQRAEASRPAAAGAARTASGAERAPSAAAATLAAARGR